MVNPKMTDEEFEAFYSELFAEFGSTEGTKNNNTAAKAPARQTAAPRYQTGSAPAYGGSMEKQVVSSKKKEQKSLNGLIICMCLECLGIVGVVLWWLLRIM